jgi:hypothetical protein
MAILIDPPAWPGHGRLWSHLVSDSSFVELHAFAAAAGVPARGFEGDHYDVPAERYAALVEAGATPVASRELLHRLVSAGLRRPKRTGERVAVSQPLGDGGRVDVLVSSRPPRGEVHGLVLVLRRGDLVAVDDDLCAPRAALTAGPAGVGGGAAWDDARQVGWLRWLPAAPAPRRIEVVLHAEAPVGRLPWPLRWVAAAELAGRDPLLAPLLSGPRVR